MMIPLLLALLAADRGTHFAVTDASGRAITGLDKSAFSVRENGILRECVDFANPESPITVVVLTDTATPVGAVSSLDEARKRLQASTSPRKVLIIATSIAAPADLGSVLILYRSNGEGAMEAAETVRSRYLLFFDSASASGNVEIAVTPQRGFSVLKVIR